VSELISVTRDKDGAVVDGDPTEVQTIRDSWTFAREVASRDPNWKLVATEAV
jgi:predicted lipid-binding transport protein (Tim44 family)